MRGVAILAVVATHARLAPGPVAATGVDVFFVLSGFLITALLAEEWRQSGTISLKKFYLRRALRLLPALALMLLVITACCWIFFSRTYGVRTLKDALTALLYSSNWVHILDFQRPGLFGHTWSLSIEEQFYFLWPFILLLLLRRSASPASMLCWVGLGIFLSEMIRIALTATGGSWLRMYCGTDTRADALLLGAALSLALESGLLPVADRLRRLLSVLGPFAALGLVLICLGDSYLGYAFDLCVVWLAVSVFAALMIGAAVLCENGWLARLLSVGLLVYIGRISYGLYLWHLPIFILIQSKHWPLPKELVVELPLSATATLASFYLLERPLLNLKRTFQPVAT